MRTVTLGSEPGMAVPSLGLGSWRFGESARTRAAEVAAVRRAFELGYRLVDTAEMYGDGGAEEVVGQALAETIAAGDLRREDVVIVTKVLPGNASERGVAAACDRSRARLRVDVVDLLLLHWRGPHPLAATVAGFEALRTAGRIQHWGVSNFDVDDLEELQHVPAAAACAANQVYYSASQRGIEFDLLPWQRRRRLVTMAYCPIDQGTLAANAALARIARQRGVTAAQLALAWTLRDGDVIAVPKAAKFEHLRENLAAADLVLDAADLAAMDALFPPPRRKQPLAMT
jgi:diketogulonate reductase-like aldo/keto reductase